MLRELTERAWAGGLRLTGDGGLLGQLTKLVIEDSSFEPKIVGRALNHHSC